MATKFTVASAATIGVAVLVTATAVSACTPKQEGPAPAAQKFFAALATGDTAAAADLSDNPSDAREALNAAWAGLQASHLDAQITRVEVRRGHRFGELPLHLASAEEPDVDLRRQAENGPLRRTLAGPLEQHRPASAPRRASDAGTAGRPAEARLGQRSRRHRRAGARLPVPLHIGRVEGRRVPDQHRPFGGRRAASVRRHDQRPTAPGRAGQRHWQAGRPDHAAHRRQQSHRPGPRQPARSGDHAAGRIAADRLPLRAGPDQSGEEVGDRPTRRRSGLARGQHQPEQRRSGGAARGSAVAGAVGVDQPGPGGAERRAATRWTTRAVRR